ncbi:hypothetical protein ABPG73_017850 [Tetrahymena malaccensis]
MSTNQTPTGKSQGAQEEQKEQGAGLVYAKINKIHLPIPDFVQYNTLEKLKAILQEIEAQCERKFENDQYKTSTLMKMYEGFIDKNFEIFEEYSKSVQNRPDVQKGLIQRYKIYNDQPNQQSLLKEFLEEKIKQNIESSSKIRDVINQKEENANKNKKKTHLYIQSDFKINQDQVNSILQNINQFGVDKCNVKKQLNGVINTETVSINFKENKVLKMITYSILYRLICSQKPQDAKKFIFKILSKIDPNAFGYHSENFLLRQIFIHFLSIMVTNIDADFQLNAVQFLDRLFAYEFISSLIFDYLFFSAQKITKIKGPIEDLSEKINCLSSAYNLNLYLVDRNNNVEKSLLKGKYDKVSNIIYIYFEQSLNQQPSQAVYFVIDHKEQLEKINKLLESKEKK